MRRMRWIVGVIAVCSLSAPVLAESVDDVIKKLDDSLAKIKSFSLKLQMEQKAEGYRVETKGTMQFMRKDGKELSRTDTDSTSEIKAGDSDIKTVMKSQQISDGQFAWSYIEYVEGPQKGVKQAFKNAYQGQMISAKSLKDLGEVKLLPDEKVDGADCYVIETSMKQIPGTKQVSYFRKSDGIAAKAVTISNDKPIGTLNMTDIKPNADIPADRFVFKAPDGVQVQDMTNPSAPSAPTPAPTPEKP
jgi:outer membrane lipoprotein-sorting protein